MQLRATVARRSLLVALLAGTAGCFDEPTFGGASTDSNGVVFTDAFGAGVNFAAFGGSKYDALSIDGTVAHAGDASLKVTVPSSAATSGGTYAGGAFVASGGRDLSGYDAITFWAKANRNGVLDTAGLGNDNSGKSLYTASTTSLPLTTEWSRYAVPTPLPSKLVDERGLFFFAASDGAAGGASDAGAVDGYTIWFDDVVWAKLGSAVLGTPAPSMQGGSTSASVTLAPGDTAQVADLAVTTSVAGDVEKVSAFPGYFDFASSNPSVATVSTAGGVQAVATGTSTITATLGGAAVKGSLTVDVAAPDPTVIALLSAKYPQHAVDKWLADWSAPAGKVALTDGVDAGDPVKTYSNLLYTGVEFFRMQNLIDATASTALHVDMNVSDATEVHVKLVDFGANGAADPPFDGAPHGDDAQGEIVLGPSSKPPLVANQWVSLDLTMTAFQVPVGQSPGLSHRAHLAQLVFAGGATPLASLAVKNVYFHR